jgi:5-methylcytosine-specific restriction enzyme subunit McrC
VCEFLAEGLLPSTTAGRFEFPDVPDESLMAAIFEEFVRNFYRRECPWLSGGVEIIDWQDAAGEPAALAKLPRMKTDALFRFGGCGWIIDAKYYAETLVAGFPGAEPKARSSHLYQLYAYLMNARRREPTLIWQGMLLYPTVSYAVDLQLELQGLHLCVQTVALDQPWRQIHEYLVKLASTVRAHDAASTSKAECLSV